MIVQRLDHAANRILHQLVVVDRVDIVLAHALQHFEPAGAHRATADAAIGSETRRT